MAKKKTPVVASTTAVPVESEPDNAANNDDTDDIDEFELLQVDLGDMVKLKQVLDEAVAGTILEHVPEDYIWDNTKLLIMFIACVFAMIAQFAPIPFPESRPVLGVCGAAYFACSGLLQLITTFVDQDAIVWTLPVDEKTATDTKQTYKNKDLFKYGLKVRSSLPRFSEWFTVTIEFQKKDGVKSPCVSQKWSVGQFFDKEGYFDEIGLSDEVDKLFEKFNQSKYDAVKSKKD